MFEPVAASKGPKVSKRAMKEYTVAMLEGTKLVARKVYPKPDHNKYVSLPLHNICSIAVDRLNDLADEQYVAKVQIPLDAAPEEINAAVLEKFTHIPAVAKYGFRVLRVKVPMVKVSGVWKKKKGTVSYLVPLKGSKELNMMNWQRCDIC
jgi:hypothetical protein